MDMWKWRLWTKIEKVLRLGSWKFYHRWWKELFVDVFHQKELSMDGSGMFIEVRWGVLGHMWGGSNERYFCVFCVKVEGALRSTDMDMDTGFDMIWIRRFGNFKKM